MEAQTKLKRTNSSLLRSSQTIRSSIHTIQEEDDEEEEVKPLKPLKSRSSGLRPGNEVYQYFPFIAILILTLSCFFFFFTEKEQIPIFWGVILIALAVFVAKRRSFGIKDSSFSKFWDQGSKRLGLRKSGCESVEWFIGNGGGSVSSLSSGRLSSRGDVKQGVEFYTSGDFYEGEFHKGRCNGSGVYNFFGNGKYEGDWIDGKYDGCGIESWTRGSRYRGQYQQGLRHGFGIYRFYTGETYAGEWCKGESHGVGVQSCSDGSCYVGEFKCGVKHGLGCYHFRNGDSYSGEYFGDKIHGFGVYHFANGHCYEGSWHEGRKQGFGHYTFRNGETNSGEWDCGVLKNPHPQHHTSEAVVHAVQASRRAAEKALHVPLVDPQVNRAVLSANRAATAARVAAIKAVQNRIDGNFSVADV